MDRDGDLVIVELKRGKAPRDVVTQALEYASSPRNDDYRTLDDRFRDFLGEHELQGIDAESGLPSLQQGHADFGREENPVPGRAFNTDQRFVLVDKDFRKVSLNMADFLRDHGIDVVCVEYQSFVAEDGDVRLLTTLPPGRDRGGRNRLPVRPSDGVRSIPYWLTTAPVTKTSHVSSTGRSMVTWPWGHSFVPRRSPRYDSAPDGGASRYCPLAGYVVRMNARGALALAVLVVVAGCAAPSTADAGVATAPSTTDARSTPGPSPSTATPSPDDGVLGWENGYWYDDPIDVNLSDGLSEAERGPYLARAMARVEHLRGHEFTRPIALDAVTPDRLRERINETGSFLSDEALSEREIRVMNVFWEALFFVDESTDARFVRSSESSAFLGAYYRSGTDTIRVVTRRPDAPIVGERLLIHELVHALQDEYADMPLETNSDDDNYATAALVEGDAELVERMYAERCEAGEWACVAPPPRTGGSDGAPDVHRGFRILRLFAYSDGPAFVYDLYRDGRGGRSGWAAVDRAFEIRPRTTEEIIHPERYPMETPAQPRSSVAPRNGWERLGGPYTVGEVEVFGMFWYQRHGYGNWIIDTSRFYRPDRERYDWYNYTSPPSEGWDGDALTVYARDGEHAYVWVTRWDSRADAEEFHGAYLELLEGHGATRSGPGNDTWVVPAGGYADAFHVELDGVRVRIVNAPSVRHLDDVDPSIG